MLRYTPFNVQAWLDVEDLHPRVLALELVSAIAAMQVVGKEKKRCRGPASNNQAWWV